MYVRRSSAEKLLIYIAIREPILAPAQANS